MTPVRTAVVGVGHQGRRHAEKLAALDTSNLVAVVDADAELGRSVAAEFGVEAVTDAGDLLGEVDAVCIATPTPSHFDIAYMFLSNGVHALVEKPLASTVENARELVELADSRKVILQVGHLERFNSAAMAVTPYVREPQFIESLRIAPFQPRSLEVSVVLDMMIHDIDLIHSFTRSQMVKVEAIGRSVFSDNVDIANARITFENGCVANVTSSRISLKTERMLRIFQSNAYFSVDLYGKKSSIFHKKSERPEDIAVEKWSCDSSDALMEQNRAFLQSVTTGSAPMVSGRVAMEALETAIAIGDRISLL